MWALNQEQRDKVEKIVSFNASEDESKGISTKWFSHIKDEAKRKEFAAFLRNNVQLLDTLKAILVKEYEENQALSKSDYNNPNWAYIQADKTGYARAIQNFINLLTIAK